MKYLKCLFLALAILALGLENVHAQYVTTHAKAAMPGQQRGIYYSLPRTVLQLDFVIEETQMLQGPYSEYVHLVGAEDYVVEDETVYKIKEVRMNTRAEADPNATFFVSMSPKKDNTATFCLTPQGILQGVGVECPQPVQVPFVAPCGTQEAVTDAGFKYQYGAGNVRGAEQMARSAAEMINKIRDEKLKLITGFQETAFNLDTYRQMYADLDAMENDYLSLFVGKKISKTMVKTIYVTPNKEVNTQSIAKFSPEEGLSIGMGGYGNVITVQTQSLQTTATMNAPSLSAVESLSLDNKLFYRIPELANVKVSIGDQVLVERRETIAQLGVFMLAPLGNTRLSLDPNTGQVTSVGMEN